ncbi:MAG: J domain-containing protein [Gammaproteobacteria bacterium]
MTQAYPLHWPDHWPRTPDHKRQASKFDADLGLGPARDDLLQELRRMGATHVVISSYLELRRDGLPLANQRMPTDPAAAAWFLYRGEQRCIPCDRWNRIQHNMRAIARTIEAMRGIERWGTGEMLKRTAHIFHALPPPGAEPPWHEVLGVPATATKEQITRAYRDAAATVHPDHGGAHDAMARLNLARDDALREARA